jgi:hypothetical protein
MGDLSLGVSKGFACESFPAEAPPVVRSATGGRFLGIPIDLYLWLGMILLVTFPNRAKGGGERALPPVTGAGERAPSHPWA